MHIFVYFQQNMLIGKINKLGSKKINKLGSKTLNLNVGESFSKLFLFVHYSRNLKGKAQFFFQCDSGAS